MCSARAGADFKALICARILSQATREFLGRPLLILGKIVREAPRQERTRRAFARADLVERNRRRVLGSQALDRLKVRVSCPKRAETRRRGKRRSIQ